MIGTGIANEPSVAASVSVSFQSTIPCTLSFRDVKGAAAEIPAYVSGFPLEPFLLDDMLAYFRLGVRCKASLNRFRDYGRLRRQYAIPYLPGLRLNTPLAVVSGHAMHTMSP
jgi:hypothetical protein